MNIKPFLKYIIPIIACLVLDIGLVVLYFMLPRIYDYDSSSNTTEYEAVVEEALEGDETYLAFRLIEVKVTLGEGEEDDRAEYACILKVERDDLSAEAYLSDLKSGAAIVFLTRVPEEEIDGEEVVASALNLRAETEDAKDTSVVTLDRHNEPKKNEMRPVRIVCIVAVLLFVFVSIFCIYRMAGIGPKKRKW